MSSEAFVGTITTTVFVNVWQFTYLGVTTVGRCFSQAIFCGSTPQSYGSYKASKSKQKQKHCNG